MRTANRVMKPVPPGHPAAGKQLSPPESIWSNLDTGSAEWENIPDVIRNAFRQILRRNEELSMSQLQLVENVQKSEHEVRDSQGKLSRDIRDLRESAVAVSSSLETLKLEADLKPSNSVINNLINQKADTGIIQQLLETTKRQENQIEELRKLVAEHDLRRQEVYEEFVVFREEAKNGIITATRAANEARLAVNAALSIVSPEKFASSQSVVNLTKELREIQLKCRSLEEELLLKANSTDVHEKLDECASKQSVAAAMHKKVSLSKIPELLSPLESSTSSLQKQCEAMQKALDKAQERVLVHEMEITKLTSRLTSETASSTEKLEAVRREVASVAGGVRSITGLAGSSALTPLLGEEAASSPMDNSNSLPSTHPSVMFPSASLAQSPFALRADVQPELDRLWSRTRELENSWQQEHHLLASRVGGVEESLGAAKAAIVEAKCEAVVVRSSMHESKKALQVVETLFKSKNSSFSSTEQRKDGEEQVLLGAEPELEATEKLEQIIQTAIRSNVPTGRLAVLESRLQEQTERTIALQQQLQSLSSSATSNTSSNPTQNKETPAAPTVIVSTVSDVDTSIRRGSTSSLSNLHSNAGVGSSNIDGARFRRELQCTRDDLRTLAREVQGIIDLMDIGSVRVRVDGSNSSATHLSGGENDHSHLTDLSERAKAMAAGSNYSSNSGPETSDKFLNSSRINVSPATQAGALRVALATLTARVTAMEHEQEAHKRSFLRLHKENEETGNLMLQQSAAIHDVRCEQEVLAVAVKSLESDFKIMLDHMK